MIFTHISDDIVTELHSRFNRVTIEEFGDSHKIARECVEFENFSRQLYGDLMLSNNHNIHMYVYFSKFFDSDLSIPVFF
jgi:hypothetical protein